MVSLPEIAEAVPIIISLIIIEGLLSVDNALAIAAMASHLPGKQKILALRWGIIGAYVFRGVALAGASLIIENPWLKIIGAAYLVHLMASHLSRRTEAHHREEIEAEEAAIAGKMAGKGFWATVASIELMDLSLSVDNVVAAVAMSPKMWVVCTGVFIGILALRFVAVHCIKLIERFPVLESCAFLLIGYVGCILIAELTLHIDVTTLEKFIGICLIIGISIGYSESKKMHAVLFPVVTVLRYPLIAYAFVSNLVLGTLLFPIKATWNFFRKKPAEAKRAKC